MVWCVTIRSQKFFNRVFLFYPYICSQFFSLPTGKFLMIFQCRCTILISKNSVVNLLNAVKPLFSTLCDNFCLCKVKCLLGKTFRTILKEETISIDLVSTQKPEEP
jgi:hypothetical protein